MMLVLRYIYLPGSNNLSHVENSFASASIKRKERGSDFSNKADFLQYVVVLYCFSFLSCSLFFGSHHTVLGWVTEPRCNPKCTTSCSMPVHR